MPTAIGRWLPLVTALAACNTATVLPPEDDRALELVETALWSGGELRVVVRYSDEEEPLPSIMLGEEELEVSRIDDTTFAAALPVHTGELPVRVELEPMVLQGAVTLHGFHSATLGPAVGGSVLVLPGVPGSIVLGSTREGAATISLTTGQVISTWPVSTQSVVCANGIVPGPAPHQVILRGIRDTDGECQSYYSIHDLSAQGIGAEIEQAMPAWGRSIAAVVGPYTAVVGFHDNWGQFFRCGGGSPWNGCQPLEPLNNFQANLYGFEIGYIAQRIFGLGIKTALHDLATGEIVVTMPHGDAAGIWYYHAAAFSPTEDSLYIAALHTQSTTGAIILLDSSTGNELDRIEFTDGMPVAIAVDEARELIHVAMHDPGTERLWLRVLSSDSHELVAELPVTSGPGEEAVGEFRHVRLVIPTAGDQVILVATRYTPWFTVGPIAPMVIVRWTLP